MCLAYMHQIEAILVDRINGCVKFKLLSDASKEDPGTIGACHSFGVRLLSTDDEDLTHITPSKELRSRRERENLQQEPPRDTGRRKKDR